MFARSLWAQEDYVKAFRALEIALDTYGNIGSGLPAEAIDALVVWSGMLMDLAETDPSLTAANRQQATATAKSYLQGALNGATHNYAEDHPIMGGIRAALAKAHELEGATSNSQREISLSEAIRGQNLQADDIEAATRLNAQGTELTSHGLYDEADMYLRRSLKIREDLSRAQDFDSSTILLKLGTIYRLQRADDQAREVLESARTIRIEVCGETHSATQIVKDTLTLLKTW